MAKTTKKSPAKKAKKKAKVAPKKAAKKEDDSSDRAKAKKIGLGLIHYRVLLALRKRVDKQFTYRDIEKATGYYSILAEVMHTDEESSLAAKGLVKAGVHDVKGRDKWVFQISAKGEKLLAEAK